MSFPPLPTSTQEWTDQLAIAQAEGARRSFRVFMSHAYKILEPQTEYKESLLGAAICEHLEAVSNGEIKRLCISAPPQMGKSNIASVAWCIWDWIDNPHRRYLCCSFKNSLAEHFSEHSIKIFKSDWYQNHFAIPRQITLEKETIQVFSTNKTGSRTCTAYESATGYGVAGGVLVVDDPHPVAVSNDVRQQQCEHFYKGLSNRPGANGSIVVLGQRVHTEDLIGSLTGMGGWEHLCLPNEYDPKRSIVTCIGWQDPRQEEGELLWPDVFTKSKSEQAKRYGRAHYEGQYNQSPVRAQGNIFDPDDFQTWTQEMISETKWDEHLMTWDFTFKDLKSSDFCVGQIWSREGGNFYLRDQVRKQADFTKTVDMFLALCNKWPEVSQRYFEESANGHAIYSALKNRIPGLLPIKARDSKYSRYQAVAPLVRSHNVFIPFHATWKEDFLLELQNVPAGRHDDQADCLAMALDILFRHVNRQGMRYVYHSIV